MKLEVGSCLNGNVYRDGKLVSASPIRQYFEIADFESQTLFLEHHLHLQGAVDAMHGTKYNCRAAGGGEGYYPQQ